jgi:hypothetical protein
MDLGPVGHGRGLQICDLLRLFEAIRRIGDNVRIVCVGLQATSASAATTTIVFMVFLIVVVVHNERSQGAQCVALAFRRALAAWGDA